MPVDKPDGEPKDHRKVCIYGNQWSVFVPKRALLLCRVRRSLVFKEMAVTAEAFGPRRSKGFLETVAYCLVRCFLLLLGASPTSWDGRNVA
jgi:hypothetical protein